MSSRFSEIKRSEALAAKVKMDMRRKKGLWLPFRLLMTIKRYLKRSRPRKGYLSLETPGPSRRKRLYLGEERIAVYTSLFGKYDVLREPIIHPDNIDYFVLTDGVIKDESLWKRLDINGLIPEAFVSDPILANRWCKMHPHLLFPDYKYSVYVDANIWPFSDFTALTASLEDFPVAMFRHKKRNCVYDEIASCIAQGKASKESLLSHLETITSHGIPRHWGLLEASVIARKHSDPICRNLMERWWDAFLRGSRRDQISLIDVLWQEGILPSTVGSLGTNLQRCDLFVQMPHAGQGESSLSVSIVIPVHNEFESVPKLFEDCKYTCEEHFAEYEIIIVNDGSTDDTGRVCRTFHPLKYVEFDRHYGQTAALDCGFKIASCDYVVAMDGDGQNDPSDIPMMLKYLVDNNLDVVCGWRKDRKDNLFRRFLMKLAYVFRQIFLRDGIHDSGCTLKVFRRDVFEELDLVGGQHRFIPAILRNRGWKVGEVVVSHRPRERGRSKYNSLSRIFHGLKDLFAIRSGTPVQTPISYKIREVIEY